MPDPGIASDIGRGRSDLGGPPYIEIGRFHAFVLSGMYVRFRTAVRLYQTHRLARHADRDRHQLISAGAVHRALCGIVKATAGYQVAEKIRSVSDAPIVVFPEPLPARCIQTHEQGAAWNDPCLPELKAAFDRVVEELFGGLDAPVVVPDQLVEAHCFTPDAYLTGARKMWGNLVYEPGQDVYHMNGEYGATILTAALPYLLRRMNAKSGMLAGIRRFLESVNLPAKPWEAVPPRASA